MYKDDMYCCPILEMGKLSYMGAMLISQIHKADQYKSHKWD